MMKRINLHVQIFLGLLTGLLLGWNYQALLPISDSDAGKTPMATSVPLFQDLQGGWLVQVRFQRNAPPEILSVEYLEAIRLGASNPLGDYSIIVLDDKKRELFAEKFQVSFLKTGSPKILEQVDRTFVVPYFENASEISVRTPQGEIHHVISTK